jgi:hypothetical protein
MVDKADNRSHAESALASGGAGAPDDAGLDTARKLFHAWMTRWDYLGGKVHEGSAVAPHQVTEAADYEKLMPSEEVNNSAEGR